MEKERWERVKDIFERAITVDPLNRAQFLKKACSGDESLLIEIDDLLGSFDSANSFLESPVVRMRTNELKHRQMIGRYEIVEQIGAGGMGEVFLATDTTLKRKVALKLLPAEYTADKERLDRFSREALAASALNHPNILTIYEIGASGGLHFIVTEYIEGQTLRSLINAGVATFEKILDIAIQSATALAAAHEVAIVHRDIKPENIMIRPDGIVKILDFGLAKSIAPTTYADSTPIKQFHETEEGIIIGTVDYMSPEQARGVAIDTRTDIWSLGVVLYEMIAGTKPFKGDTASDSIAAILMTEAEPLPPETPFELRQLVAKTLQRDPNERYQTATDLLVDLKDLKQNLRFDTKLERTVATLASEAPLTTSGDQIAETASRSGSWTTAAHPASRWLMSGAMVVAIIFAILGVFYYFARNNSQPIPSAEVARIDSLAVLPFENSAPDTEYLSDGITESVINSLSNLPDLRVISRDTVFGFKGKAATAKDIGKTLNVRTVLTGKVTQRGDELTIQTNLVDLVTDSNIWGHRYNIRLSDVISVEGEIAQEITSALQLKLSNQQRAQIAKQYTENSDAYREYLKGRYYSLQYTPDGHKKALEHLNKAIDIDPTYALAFAGIADAYTTASDTFLPPHDALSKAKAAAQKAIDLDDQLAEAWAARGHARLHEWDRAAIEDLDRAAALAPRSLTTQLWLGEYYMIWDLPRSVEVLQDATRLDPLSSIPHGFLSFDYYMLRQNDNALASAKKSIELNPTFFTEYAYMARCYFTMGNLQAAEETLKKVPPEATDAMTISSWIIVLAAEGKKDEARGRFAEMKKLARTQYISPLEFAVANIALKDMDQAFIDLDRAYDDRSETLGFIRNMPYFDPIRTDPRYNDLMRKIGFVQ